MDRTGNTESPPKGIIYIAGNFPGIASLVFAIALMMPATISAQIDKDTTMLGEVVITATKSPQSKGNVTQKIDIIGTKEIGIAITGNRNIAEVMQNQQGASVTTLSRNDANWGTFDGVGPKYSTYMLHGLPVDSYIDPMNLDLSAVSRIEIQRGPASVLYPGYLSQDFAGSQSPLAGTVNLILKERIDRSASRVSLSLGSYNTLNGQVYHQGSSKGFNYFAGVNYEMSDYTNYGAPGSWLNMQKDPEYRKAKIYGGVTWFSDNDNHKLTIFVNKTLHYGDAGRVYRGFNNDYGVVNAGYSLKLTPRIMLQAHIGYRSYNRKWQESQFNEVDSLTSNNGMVQHIVPADVSLTFKHGKSNILAAGIDYQEADYNTYTDPLQGYDTYGNKSTATLAGIYAQEELRLGKFIIRAGLRGNYTRSKIELVNGSAPGQTSRAWTKLIYSGGLKFNPSKSVSLYTNIGNSFITPGLKSVGGTLFAGDTLHSGQVPNPSLQPESGLCIDLGTDLSLPLNFRISLRGFTIMINDAIVENVVRQSPSQTQSVNAGKTSSAGVEIGVTQQVGSSFNWYANLTWMKSEVSNDFDPDQDGASIPFSPEWIANAGLSYSAPFGLQIAPSLNYNDGFYDSSSKSSRQKFTPGITLNAWVSQTILSRENLKVSCFGQFYNITNNRYLMPWQFQNTGFSFMAGLEVVF